MLVADADRERHRHDAAADRGPKAVEKLLVVAQEDDDPVAARGAHRLQVVKYAERARKDLAVGDAPLRILAVDVANRAIDAAIVLEDIH